MAETPIELSWGVDATTGWGLFALHLALGFARSGRKVYLPSDSSSPTHIPAPLLPTIEAMGEPGYPSEYRIRFDAYGNHWPPFHAVPNRFRVLLAVFEDSAIPASVIPDLQRYDLILAPSAWVKQQLALRGIASTVWHQGYDDAVFTVAPRRRPSSDRLMIFSGGKLEFRKGQDIVVEAFKRFRETPEGHGAHLVTAWQNKWPQTMEGIWSKGYVKGVPTMRAGALDIPAWLEANGIPRDAHTELGLLPQESAANAIRECDIGVFPNRGEGATNMVLVETQALGLPCIVSQNTGHLDVQCAYPLMTQPPVTTPCSLFGGMDGWGESDPDEIVDALRSFALIGAPAERIQLLNPFSWPLRHLLLSALLPLEVAHA